MAVSPTLRRLLRVLNLQEEQSKLALESSTGQLRRLESAAEAAIGQARAGRRLVSTSAQTGELPDRLAGMEETQAARRRTVALGPRIEDQKLEVEDLRQEFLAKRVECRQAETLIHEAEMREAIETGRRQQQNLDSWYLNRRHAAAAAAARSGSASGPDPAATSQAASAPDDPALQNLSEDLSASTIDVLNRDSRFRS